MTLFPHEQPEQAVVTANNFPEHNTSAAYLLPGAAVTYTVWQQNSILLQSVPVGAASLHLYQVYVNERQVLTAEATESITALWFVLKGSANVFTEGLGEDVFLLNDCVLAYNPASSRHRICLKKGMFVFACLVLSNEQLQNMAQVNNQLAYFAEHVVTGNNQSLMQLTIKTSADSLFCLRQLMACDYRQQGNEVQACELANALVHGYVRKLQEEMCRKKMNGHMVVMARKIWAYIDAHFHCGITRGELAQHFNVSYFIIDKAFKSLTNQTVKQYIIERCLLRAHDYLQSNEVSVKCCAYDIGMNYNSFVRHYKHRFGCTPSASKRGRV